MDDLIKNGVKPNSKTRKKSNLVIPRGLLSVLNTSNEEIAPKSVIRSPRDETPIMINGEAVDLEKSIQDRINKVSSPNIKPMSPPKFPNLGIDPTISTPAVLPYNEVNIIESESENEAVPAPNVNMDFSSLLLGAQHTPPKFVQEAIAELEFKNLEREISFKDSVEESIPEPIIEKPKTPKALPLPPSIPLPLPLPLPIKQKEPEKIVEEIISKESSDSEKTQSFFPKFESRIIPDTPEQSEKESTPVPVFSYKPRVVSPIQTLNAPKSPSPRPKFTIDGRSSAPSTPPIPPIKTEENRFAGAREAGAREAGSREAGSREAGSREAGSREAGASLASAAISAAMNEAPRVKSPYNRTISPPKRNIATINESSTPITGSNINLGQREVVISPKRQPQSPQRTQYYQQTYTPESQKQEIMPSPVYIPPQYQDPRYARPDYSRLSPEQQQYLKAEFKVKFGILRANYPQWQIVDIHDSFTLDQISDLYEYYVRQIMVTKESGNYKVYLVVFFMVVEVIGVKILKLNMSGYTMSQLRRMHQYDSLLIELGEKWLVDGGSNWPVEARLVMTATFNAVIFLGVKYLCNWMGVEGLSDTIQNFLDAMINGPENSMNNQQSYIAPQSGSLPQNIPKSATQNTTSGAEQQQNTGNPLDGIASMFGGLFGGGNKSTGNASGGAGGFADTIAQLGTAFTSKMQENNKAKAAAPVNKPTTKPPVKKLNKKKLFSD
jgi:hypothetical protein